MRILLNNNSNRSSSGATPSGTTTTTTTTTSTSSSDDIGSISRGWIQDAARLNQNETMVTPEASEVSFSQTTNQSVDGGSKRTKVMRKAARSTEHPRKTPCKNEQHSDDGYNSEDEYSKPAALTDIAERERTFETKLKQKNWLLRRMKPDGNCLFRAVGDQIFGDAEMHDKVRAQCMDYMWAEKEHFSQFVTEDFAAYIARKRQDKVHGNNLEIQAMSEIYNRPMEVYEYDDVPMNIFHDGYTVHNAPLRLSYHYGNHYNSIYDLDHPSVGVGLGLPDFHPGLADKTQMQEAINASEQELIEQALIEESKKLSEMTDTDQQFQEQLDLLSTEEEIEKQIMMQSLCTYLAEQQKFFAGQSGKS